MVSERSIITHFIFGSKVGDEDHFDIAFETLNTSYSYELDMKEGEALDVTVQAESGNISLIIRRGDDEPIYRGNNLESTAFQIGIEQEGTYTLTVEGKRARNNYIPFVETTHFLTKTPQFLIV